MQWEVDGTGKPKWEGGGEIGLSEGMRGETTRREGHLRGGKET